MFGMKNLHVFDEPELIFCQTPSIVEFLVEEILRGQNSYFCCNELMTLSFNQGYLVISFDFSAYDEFSAVDFSLLELV